MSNYSDLNVQVNSLPASLPPNDVEAALSPRITTHYLENRNLQQVAILTENEMRVLC